MKNKGLPPSVEHEVKVRDLQKALLTEREVDLVFFIVKRKSFWEGVRTLRHLLNDIFRRS